MARLRPCLGCGALQTSGSWCRFCEPPRTRGRKMQALRAAYVIGKQCVYCGRPAEQLDHVKPVRWGGTDNPSNLQPLCRACNLAKSDSR
jgi:5-methylcytosine-specific restriction endonuclease McrA